ncbi:MAG TPA: four helix bundle protein [Terriglobales bacterium]|nr:four helix bundle protein [Terriglobales bacterium]
MRNYRELKVWQRAHQLTLDLHKATRSFPQYEQYGLTSQIRRAASSIGANLAEGCGRRGDAEFARFVLIAMGSASELDYHLLLARDLSFLPFKEYERLAAELAEIRRMLTSLLLKVKEGPVLVESRAKG